MIELPLVFIAGVLGTAHCLGMCGPLVLGISVSSPNWVQALLRQLSYSAGRLFVYSALGLVAGYCGAKLAGHSTTIINIPALLAIVAGAVFIYQGLRATGLVSHWLRYRRRPSLAVVSSSDRCERSSNGGCITSAGLLAPFLRGEGLLGALLAGVFTGFLPCGLLYGMLALATSTHSLLLGAATMLVFGLGTVPLLVLTGVGGHWLSVVSRRRLYSAAAWCLVLTGVVSVARGASYLATSSEQPGHCPLCTSAEVKPN